MSPRKTALITGGGTGIGRGIALALAGAGYDVAVNYHSSAEGARTVCAQAEQMGARAHAIAANLADVAGVERLFAECRARFDHLDLFVNNAGITLKVDFLKADEKTFDTMCNLDFKGAYFCMQQAGRWMVETRTKGGMVVISSNNHAAHFAGCSIYGPVKAALTKLAEHAALELARHGIRVNTIAPGWTDTGAARLDDKEGTYYKIPLKRWCTPEEIGQAVLFLASEAAASITGATLVMDGGALLLSDKGEKYGL